MITIKILQQEDRARWDDFVLHCPSASFFHRAGWQHVIEQAFGHRTWFLYAEKENTIVGIFPLAEIKSRLFGHVLSSLPFCVYGGIVVIDETARSLLEQAALTMANNLQVGHLETHNEDVSNPDWISKDLYVTFRKTLDVDEEKNMLAIPRKQRAMVRKGIKLGLVSEIDDDVDRFFYAYASSVHRLGTPVFSKKYFALLKKVFSSDCQIMTILHEGKTVASVLSFYFRDQVLPYYGGGTALARDLAANDFMYWELMRRATADGVRVFDFGRSKRGTGAFDFKKNWGFDPTPLHYEYKLICATSVPDNNPLNPKYQLFIRLWKKMPLFLANYIGPHIVKNLG